MSKFFKISLMLFLVIAIFSAFVFYQYLSEKKSGGVSKNSFKTEQMQKPFLESDGMENSDTVKEAEKPLKNPMDNIDARITKKPFGFFVSPQNSPVSPERFRGYHTAIDLETFPEELEKEISVTAFCSGKLLVKRNASGYGGVAVQACDLENQLVTVIYGHLKLSSITKDVGDEIKTGEIVGILGNAYSAETDGERKHLHFGIHKGESVNLLGYVQNANELSDWLDPCAYVCEKNAR